MGVNTDNVKMIFATTGSLTLIKIINNSNIQIEEIGNNSINAVIVGGTPKYEYQLLDENGDIVTPWQSSSVLTNLITNYYQIQVKTENTICTSIYDLFFLISLISSLQMETESMKN